MIPFLYLRGTKEPSLAIKFIVFTVCFVVSAINPSVAGYLFDMALVLLDPVIAILNKRKKKDIRFSIREDRGFFLAGIKRIKSLYPLLDILT